MSSQTLRAGAARRDITPDPAMRNWVTGQPYDGLVDPLHVRAVCLGDGHGEALLIAWDLINASEEFVAEARAAMTAATGIPGDRILINASHTHSAPRSPFRTAEDTAVKSDRLAPFLDDAVFLRWGETVAPAAAAAAAEAREKMVRAELFIGRADVGEWIFNRRPYGPDGQVTTMMVPVDATVLPDGLSFGPIDPTLTVVCLRDTAGQAIATLCHANCHPVQVYPHHGGISADYPGLLCAAVAEQLGGEALFLQGCAGNQVPARRGLEARGEMAARLAHQAVAAAAVAAPLPAGPLTVASGRTALALKPEEAERFGREVAEVESMTLAIGDLAFVTLPGEPLLEVGQAIRPHSPFGHTLVLGYTNGYFISYLGLPGEQARGGYEAKTARTVDLAGRILVDHAERIMHLAAASRK